MEETHLKFHHDISGSGNEAVLTVLQGQAAKVYDPEQVKLDGIITAPSEYYKKRKEIIMIYDTNVIFNKAERKITLTVNESDKFKTVVTGSLKRNKFLSSLSINSTSSYSIADLVKTLRFAKRYFADPSKHSEFLVKLRNFTAKITQTTTRADDRAGNKSESFESKVSEFISKNDLSFTLKLPIFEGTDEVNITIDVEIDVVNGSVVLFLICDDLEEMEDNLMTQIFEAEKQIFEPFVIIEQ